MLSSQAVFAQLTVDDTSTNAEISDLISGSGLDITNFTVTSGLGAQIGTFGYTPDGVLGLDQGMVISTGNLAQLGGLNDEVGSTVDNGFQYNDPDLLAIDGNCNNDVVVIEFDVIPKCDTLVIDFQFASEEYPEYVCSNFNDAFAFLVSGPEIAGPYTNGAANFAILPDGTDVTINGVNGGLVGAAGAVGGCTSLTNTAFYTDNTGGLDLEFDGFTTPLQAKGVVVPCQTYHVKILLGDAADGQFDSAVFLKSFSCPSQAVTLVPDPIFSDAIEGCQFGLFNLTRSGDTTVPLLVDFTLGGSASATDYTFEDVFGNIVTSPISYLANEVDKYLLIRPTADALTEGDETVDLNLEWWMCSDRFTLTETINLIDNYMDVTCQNDTTIFVNSGTCSKDFNFGFPSISSACSGSLSRQDASGLNSGDLFPLGTTTITWRGSASGGLITDDCSFNVTVVDNEAPVAACQNITLQLDNSGNASLVAADLENGSTDNCSISGISASQTSFDCSNLGLNNITLTVTDGSGNTHSCVAIVTVEDNIDPVDITLPLVSAQCSVTLTPPTTTDNCDGVLTATTSDPLVYSVQGTSSVTWTFTDSSGNFSTEVQSITIDDTTAPNSVCQNITVQLDASGNSSIITTNIDGGSTDNCNIAFFSASQTDFDCSHIGTNSITLTVTDDAGNTDSCLATVTVEDNIDPTLTTQDITIQLDGSGSASITPADVTNSAGDNCGTPVITVDQTSFDCSEVGANTVTVTSTDANGNVITAPATVTVEDTVNPTAVCLDITVGLDTFGNATIEASDVDGGSSDNCAIATMTVSPSSFTSLELGANNVTLTVTDVNGNVDTCTSVVTVSDSNPPNAVCQDITIALDASGNAVITSADIDGGSTDNGVIVSIVASQTEFDCSHVGTNSVTLTVTDDAGNTDSCLATVTVEDNIDPTLTTRDITIQLDGSGSASITPADVTNSAGDNCGTPVITVDQTSFDCSEVGANTVTVTSTDANGNVITAPATVTVEDNVNPTAVCLDITVGLDTFGNAVITAADVDGGSSDNCAIATMTASPDTFTSAELGANNVVLTVTDVNGNVDTCTSVVTVSDSNPPNALCQDIIITLDGSGNAVITSADIDGGSTDNGVIVSIVASQTDFDCSHVGTNSVTLTVTDDAGNSSTCEASVTVLDNIGSTLITQDITIQLDETGNANITPVDVTNLAEDNCGTPVVTVNQTTFDCSELGANTVTVTSTDANGNTITAPATVTVEDTVNPTAVCLDITVGLDAFGVATIVASDVDGGSSDNCVIVDMTIDIDFFDSTNLGENIVILTVTDSSGNIDQCQSIVTIEDSIVPTAICQDVVIILDDSGNGSISAEDVDGGSYDNGGIATLTVSQTNFDCSHLGENTVALTVEDLNGNIDTCEATVTVIDEMSPQILECVPNKHISYTDNCEYSMPSYLDEFEFYDNCADVTTATIVQTPAPGELFSGNQIIDVSISVTDSYGLIDVCEFTITLTDNVPPFIECYSNQVYSSDPGSCDKVLNFDAPNSEDNCGIESIVLTQGLPSGSTFPLGETLMEYTVTDFNGNVSMCSYTITIEDNELPEIFCFSNQTMEADENCEAVVENYMTGLLVTDNCSTFMTLTQTPEPGTVFSGSIEVFITAEDINGNIQTCEIIVQVIDTTLPTIECPDDIVQIDSMVNYELPEYSDNCSAELIIVEGLETGTEFPHGNTEVSYLVEDSSGNTVECSFIVLINTPPIGAEDSTFVDSWIDDIVIEVISNDEDPDNDDFEITDLWTTSGSTDAFNNGDGTIDFIIYDEDWCGEDELVYIICDTFGACDTVYSPIILDCFDGIIIPEGFSPNDDGVNDVLEIKGIQHFPNNTVEIFNRWGHKLFKQHAYNNDWDGSTQTSLNFGDGLLPEGTYFVIVDLGDGSPPLKSYLYLNR